MFAILVIKTQIKLFEFKTINFSKWLTLSLKRSRWEKWQWKLIKMRWFAFQKSDLLFDHWNPGPNRPILRDIWGQNILTAMNAIKEAQRSTTTIMKMALPLTFFSLFGANLNQRTEWKWQALSYNYFLILVVFFTKTINFWLSRTLILENLVGRPQKDFFN